MKNDVFIEIKEREMYEYFTKKELELIGRSLPIKESGIEEFGMFEVDGVCALGEIDTEYFDEKVNVLLEYHVDKYYVIQGKPIHAKFFKENDVEVIKKLTAHVMVRLLYAVVYSGDTPDEVLDRYNRKKRELERKRKKVEKRGGEFIIKKFSKK